MKELLSTSETCKILKMTRLTLHKLVKDGKIPAFKIGRFWKFERNSIDAWIQSKLDESNKTIKQ